MNKIWFNFLFKRSYLFPTANMRKTQSEGRVLYICSHSTGCNKATLKGEKCKLSPDATCGRQRRKSNAKARVARDTITSDRARQRKQSGMVWRGGFEGLPMLQTATAVHSTLISTTPETTFLLRTRPITVSQNNTMWTRARPSCSCKHAAWSPPVLSLQASTATISLKNHSRHK